MFWSVLAAVVTVFTACVACVHSVRATALAAPIQSLCGFSGSPVRLTGVVSSLGRVRLTGLGCGKALWDSPGRGPGVGGATSTTSADRPPMHEETRGWLYSNPSTASGTFHHRVCAPLLQAWPERRPRARLLLNPMHPMKPIIPMRMRLEAPRSVGPRASPRAQRPRRHRLKAAKCERKQAKQQEKEAARMATEDAGRTVHATKRSIHGEA